MTKICKREVIKLAINGFQVPYVPWHCSFTLKAYDKLAQYFNTKNVNDAIGNHFLDLGSGKGFFEDIGHNCVRDVFGVVWDRSVDKDIGIVVNPVLPEPMLKKYHFPDPLDKRFFKHIPSRIAQSPDLYRRFLIGFSVYERAWTLRGMENLLMDFYEHPDFVHELLHLIVDYNIAQIKEALKYDIDAVHFGDDWGQQQGLQMCPNMWREFIYPELVRMYAVVKDAGKNVSIHSCGDVDELFDDLIGIGVNCFNPFQPEVMNVFKLMKDYKGRLAFHGGLSTQKTLPYGSTREVGEETYALLRAGADTGYIFAPAHAVQGDVSLENMLTFIEILNEQHGYKNG